MSWNLNSPCSVMTVWPALLPPCERMTTSAFSARESMTFPFPSSPHWPPTRMMTTVLLGSWFGPAGLQVVEPRVVAAELQLDHAGRPVAVLGDVELGDAWSLIGFVVLWAKQKHYNVTILFDTSRFSQIAQDRALVWTLFGSAAELRDGDHGDAQLASQSFEGARDRGDLLDTVVVATRATVHQLEVVDQDHVDVVVHLGLSRLEQKGQLVHHRRVVDEDRRFAEWTQSIRHAIELGLGQQATMHSLRIDLCLLGQQALGELLFRHLEAEDRNRLLRLQCGVQRDVKRQRGFSHRGTPRHDDQVRVLEPACHPVQIVESRRDPDDPLPALHLQGDPPHGRTQEVVELRELALVPVVSDTDHNRLPLVDRLLGVDRIVVAEPRDV